MLSMSQMDLRLGFDVLFRIMTFLSQVNHCSILICNTSSLKQEKGFTYSNAIKLFGQIINLSA